MINRISSYFDAPQRTETGLPDAPRAQRVARAVERQRRRAEKAIRFNPGLALLGAAALGIALAFWIKRR
jgi:hypothetical protein